MPSLDQTSWRAAPQDRGALSMADVISLAFVRCQIGGLVQRLARVASSATSATPNMVA